MGLLDGRRILVTGGSSGIGRGICTVAAKEGARVAFVWSENASGADKTVSMIESVKAEAMSIHEDLRDPDSAHRIVSRLESEWGGIDGLVNNAGMSESVPFVLLDDQDISALMEVNLISAVRMARSAIRPMIRQRSGRVVNMSSIAGSRAIPGPVHYAMSKGGIDGMTKSLAHEVGPYGILVNAVAAGIFEGGLRSTIPEHHQKRYLEACALSRFGRPEECGELVAWLLSDRNTYLNGSVMILDGGTVT